MRKDAGFSLIELMIVMVILGVIVAITIGLMITSSRNAANQSIQGHIEDRGRTFVDQCKIDFGYALLSDTLATGGSLNGSNKLGIIANTNGTEIRYVHPVNVDTSSSTNSVTYGYSSIRRTDAEVVASGDAAAIADIANRVGRWCVIRFEPHTVLRESSSASSATVPQFAASWNSDNSSWGAVAPPTTLDVEIVNLDINGDADKDDVFVMGKLVKYVATAAGVRLSTEGLSDYVILRYDSSTGIFATPTGATISDRLFSYVPNTILIPASPMQIKVNVMLGRLDERRQKFLTTTCSEQIMLRNKQ